MLRSLAPDLHLNSVLELTVGRLRTLGLQGLLLDVDCTLKDYHAERIPEPVQSWIEELRSAGVRMCLLSNGKSRRIGRLAQTVNLPYVARALKPLPFGCYRGLRRLALRPAQVAVVGDQLFADVLAGRLAGLFTVLVRPTSPAEPWFTRIKRPFERGVLDLLNTRPRTARNNVPFQPLVTPNEVAR
ncbi:MAG: YqeG family HAD IIIA-type phosphatase [Gemmataceae bacterium]|nr:YqeG family HAD IIIA-type phosphatase [Gemmataceae bacterium]